MSNRIKVHFTHKWRIKQLFSDGFTIDELIIMYRAPMDVIKNITQGITPKERI